MWIMLEVLVSDEEINTTKWAIEIRNNFQRYVIAKTRGDDEVLLYGKLETQDLVS